MRYDGFRLAPSGIIRVIWALFQYQFSMLTLFYYWSRKEHELSTTYEWHIKNPVELQVVKIRRRHNPANLTFILYLFDHSKEDIEKLISDEFDELTARDDGYSPVVKGSTSAIFRHGYSARYGIHTLMDNLALIAS